MCGTEPGSIETYNEQVCMPINGKVQAIDKCIHHIVAALNAGGVETTKCCCGHRNMIGNIVLKDGRWIGIFANEGEWRSANDAVKSRNAIIKRLKQDGTIKFI